AGGRDGIPGRGGATMSAPARTGRPAAGEFAAYATADIAAVPGDDAVEALQALGTETPGLLSHIGETAAAGLTYAPGKWTLKEVLGHLADDERIFAYRALCIARNDPRELPGFDENLYLTGFGFEDRTLASLLDEYRAVRGATVALLYPASVRGLAFHIAGHELHHLRVLRREYLSRLR
ncbi:MAG: DinB family protein, partial [Gemmatimonadales bacterium]